MLKRFLIAFVLTTLISGSYFYYLKNNGEQQQIADADEINTDTKQVTKLETAAGDAADPSANVEFTLTDQNGKTVTDKDLHGKKLLVFFGFTSCPDICPVSMAVMSEVMNQLDSAKVTNILPIFISIDPKHDTPEELKKFLKDYHPGFMALTGQESEIDKLKQSFKVYAQAPKDAGDDMPDHSNLIYYMDTNGKYISHFSGDSAPEDIVDYISSHN